MQLYAQSSYTMGYKVATIDVVDKGFFSIYELPGQDPMCGMYDKSSATFYTCDYKTYRHVNEDYISFSPELCCSTVDFDPAKYYGTLTLKGVIEKVEWDSMVFYFTTDKARLRVETDEREIDALYKKFYKENIPGKVHLILCLKTYDTPNENQLSFNVNTQPIVKPKRTFIKILRW